MKLKEAHEKLESLVEERIKELQALSYQDGLTEIANRRKFDQVLELEWQRVMRHKEELSLIMSILIFSKLTMTIMGIFKGISV